MGLRFFGVSSNNSVAGAALLRNNGTAGNIIKIASVLGIFQAGMTVIGYTMGLGFEKYICAFDHWIVAIPNPHNVRLHRGSNFPSSSSSFVLSYIIFPPK